MADVNRAGLIYQKDQLLAPLQPEMTMPSGHCHGCYNPAVGTHAYLAAFGDVPGAQVAAHNNHFCIKISISATLD